MKIINLRNMSVQIDEPAVVALSAPGETRWGYHQFPAISRLPDRRLLVTFNDCADNTDAYGTPGPAYLSVDEGQTWNKWDAPNPFLAVAHSVISPIYNGQHLCVPMSPPLDIAKSKIELPAPSGRVNGYGEILFYRLSECPAEVHAFQGATPGMRWLPEEGQWRREDIVWDTREALIRSRPSTGVVARPYIDNRILMQDGMLYYANYLTQHMLSGRCHPANYACWCMISEDNGHSWRRQGLIAHDPSGELMMGEPCLLPTSGGELACIIRCADHRQKPMLIAYSADKGRTWSETRPLWDFGVMPQAVLLDNGVAVLAFGRPGVHLMFSPDGSAREWVGPVSLVAGTAQAVHQDSCGYTRLLPVSENAFLIVYSAFRHVAGDGQVRKAILVRKILVSRHTEPAQKAQIPAPARSSD